MTLYEFNRLPEDRQLELVWDQATFLVKRKIGQSYLLLYALDDFYAEIRYRSDHNTVTACRSLRSLIPLEPSRTWKLFNSLISVPHNAN